MSRCGINGSAESNMHGLKWMYSGEMREDNIWLHWRSWDNRVEVDFAFSRFMENNIDRFPGLYRPTMVPPRWGMKICMSVLINMHQHIVRSTSVCYHLQYKCPGKWEQETIQMLNDISSWLPLTSVTLLPPVGRQSMEEFKRWGREQGKQDFNFRRQGLRRREQKGQWKQVLSERETAGPNPQRLLELLVLGKILQIHW